MNFLRQRPWLLLVAIGALSLIAWIAFIVLAAYNPVQRVDVLPK